MKLLLTSSFFVAIIVFLAACGSAPESNTPSFSSPLRAAVDTATPELVFPPESPSPSMAFLRFADEVSRLEAAWVLDFAYSLSLEECEDFVLDLVYLNSSNAALNRLVTDKIEFFVGGFLGANNGGNIYARPSTYAYNGHIFGLSVDFRYYGDVQGFGASRLVTNFDLRDEIPIANERLFEADADFRAAFAELLPEFTLRGTEYFTFDDEYIFLHLRTHESDTLADSYLVLPLPLADFEGLWTGPPPPTGRRIALTFDDGPHYRFSPILLDALAERGVSATFFLLGDMIYDNAEIVQRMYDEGHEIGNHSYSHGLWTRLDEAEISEEIERANSLIYDIIAFRPTLLRPPFGVTTDNVMAAAYKADKSVLLWSVDPRDWEYRDADTVRDNIINHTRSGSVILVHDIHESSILGTIMAIDILLARGYDFVTVSELYWRAGNELSTGGLHRSIYRDLWQASSVGD